MHGGAAALVFAAIASGMLLHGCGRSGPEPPERPNVLLVVVDTLRWDHLRVYGYERDTTPVLDRFADDATRFERAYSASPWTKPAVASILTGLNPRSHTATSMFNRLPDSVDTLAEILAEEGYATAAVVSHSLIGRLHGFGQGFDAFENLKGADHQITSQQVTARAIDCITKATADERPFFVLVHYFDPHWNFIGHPEFGFAKGEQVGRVRSGGKAQKANRFDPPITAREVEHMRDLYDEEVRFTDAAIGEVFDALRASGHYDDTLIVVTADHGEEFFERGCVGHARTLYEELVRVPLLVRAPGHSGGARVVSSPVSTIALVPTILELIGIEPGDRSFDAGSVGGVVRGTSEVQPEPIFTETDFRPSSPDYDACPPTRADLRGIVLGDYKLIFDLLDRHYELYALNRDADERENLVEEEPEVFEAMRALLRAGTAPGASPQREGEEAEISDEELEQLRGLGYIVDEP